MGPRESEDGAFLRITIDSDSQPCKIAQKNARVRLGDPLATFAHHKDVQRLADDRFFSLDSDICGIGPGILLILNAQHAGIDDPARRPSVLPTFFTFGQEFLNGDFAGSLSKLEDTRQCSIDFFLPSVHLRHDPGDGAAMAGDDQRFAPLHIIEQLRQMGFGFGSLDFRA